MNIADLCTEFITIKSLKDDSERNIIEFAEAPWGLGLGSSVEFPPLFPVQKFYLKCSYNIPLDDTDRSIIVRDRFNEKELYHFTELEYLKYLYEDNRINVKEITGDPKDTRNNICLVIGRRGTKTTLISISIAYEIYKLLKKFSPHQFYNIMPTDEIWITCIATKEEQSSEIFGRITGHLEHSDFFKRYRSKPTANFMYLNSEWDIQQYGYNQRPSIKVVAAPCSARGLRSHNNIVVIFDEMAYFFESEVSADKSAKAVYESVTPSVAGFNAPDGTPHGRIISISSAGVKRGQFYELYQRSFEADCKDLLMIQAPSWEANPTLSSKWLRMKYVENPLSYNSEFGGQFNDKITAWIENEQILRMNVIPGLKVKSHTYERVPHFMGVDVALQNDGTAIVICHIVKKETSNGMKSFIELDLAEVRYAKDEGKEFFNPDEITDWIILFAEKFFIIKGDMDQHYGLSIVPQLHTKGYKQFSFTTANRESNSRMYQNLMIKMLDASLRLPEGDNKKDHPLVAELLTLQATQHSKYLITVEAPQSKNSHDDLSDAYARAVLLATEYMNTGGTSVKQNVVESTAASSAMSYKRYFRKSKETAMFTNRPSSSVLADLTRTRGRSLTGRF